MSEIHPTAKAGFGTGTNELYDKARPSYPPQALNALYKYVTATEQKPKLKILELGSGTGIFTRALLGDPVFGVAVGELKAVEPSEGMRNVFSERTQDFRVSTYEGTFDTTKVEDGWADLIVVAQAWHWCPDFNKAMTEFARALKPHGVAAFIWNLEDRDTAKWVAQARDAYEEFDAGTPQYRLGHWRQTFSTQGYKENFADPIEDTWTRAVPTTTEGVIDRALSKSFVTMLTPEQKDDVAKKLRAIVEGADDRVWIDKDEGVFEYPYQTRLVIMKKSN